MGFSYSLPTPRNVQSRRAVPYFDSPEYESQMMTAIARQAKLDGEILGYDRPYEGRSLGIAENRLALHKAGFPAMSLEGNMGDQREFDEARTLQRVDAFMETFWVKRVAD